jgi:malonate transporter and related proteins
MIATFETLTSVFLLIGLGFALRHFKIISETLWQGVEKLGYYIFFPALLFETLARSQISDLPLTAITFTMMSAFASMAALLLLFQKPLQKHLALNGPGFSSVFQSAMRWNGFVALPILAKLQGKEGVALVAVIIGSLVPLANVLAVIVVARNVNGPAITPRQTLVIVFRNPFIWATALGLLVNLLHIPIYEPVMNSLSMLGGAAIGCGLLLVGSGLILNAGYLRHKAIWLATGLKLIGMPLLVIAYASFFGVSGTALLACIVCAAVPTAMSAYVLARQMGGDAEIVAAAVTLQTLVSAVTIPIFLTLAKAL